MGSVTGMLPRSSLIKIKSDFSFLCLNIEAKLAVGYSSFWVK